MEIYIEQRWDAVVKMFEWKRIFVLIFSSRWKKFHLCWFKLFSKLVRCKQNAMYWFFFLISLSVLSAKLGNDWTNFSRFFSSFVILCRKFLRNEISSNLCRKSVNSENVTITSTCLTVRSRQRRKCQKIFKLNC